MNKQMKHIMILSGITSSCIFGINRFIDSTSGIKNLLPKNNGNFFEWRHGNIFYTKQGKGSPILLIHDLHPASSSAEWSLITKKLQKDHTVYTIDLLGCGRSDKPNFTYTNYMFVQLITDFVKKVIGRKTDIAVTGDSCSFAVMAVYMDDNIFQNIFLISPESLETLQRCPSKKKNCIKKLLELPLFGTFLYNLQMAEDRITDLFEKRYHWKKSLISGKQKDIYYESAHADHSKGRFLLASILGNYTNINIIPALKKIENPIFLIGSRNLTDMVKTMDSYVKYDETIETAYLSDCGKLPQLEKPDELYEIFRMFYDL